MISPQAQDGIRRIMFNALRSRLVLNAADTCDIQPLDRSRWNLMGESCAYVLTISAMQFRLLLVLRLSPDQGLQDYYLRDHAEKPFEDAFLEIANLCCGAINQELIRHFPDMGMSTPYRLSNHCMRFIETLRPAYSDSYTVTINGGVKLGATVCLCANAPVDFNHVDVSVEVESGELEMF